MTKVSEEIRQTLLSGGTVTAKAPFRKKRVIVDAFAIKGGEDAGKPYTDFKMRTNSPDQGASPSQPTPAAVPAVPSNIPALQLSKEDAEAKARHELHLEGFTSKGGLVKWAKETYGLKLKKRDTKESLEDEIVAYYVARLAEG